MTGTVGKNVRRPLCAHDTKWIESVYTATVRERSYLVRRGQGLCLYVSKIAVGKSKQTLPTQKSHLPPFVDSSTCSCKRTASSSNSMPSSFAPCSLHAPLKRFIESSPLRDEWKQRSALFTPCRNSATWLYSAHNVNQSLQPHGDCGADIGEDWRGRTAVHRLTSA